MNNEKWTKWIPLFIVGLALIIAFKTIENLPNLVGALGKFLTIISPFLFGVLIVYFVYVPCKKLEELYTKSKIKMVSKKARLFSVLSVYLIIGVMIVLIGTFVMPVLFRTLLDLAEDIPKYYENILSYVNKLPADSVWNKLDIKETLNNIVNNNLNRLLNPDRIDQYFESIVGVAGWVFNAVISLVVSLYILLEREHVKEFFENLGSVLFNSKTNIKIKKYLNKINNVLFTFIASKGLDSMINIVVITTILFIFDVEYALLLGIICGLANFIPYIGTLVAVIVMSLLTFITGGITQAITVLIFLVVFQQIDANFIEPRIMGNNLEISPLLVILAVIIGGAYFGIVGMFLGVPVITILKQVLQEYVDSRKTEDTIRIVER